jgi:hypothetical protein
MISFGEDAAVKPVWDLRESHTLDDVWRATPSSKARLTWWPYFSEMADLPQVNSYRQNLFEVTGTSPDRDLPRVGVVT